MGKTTGITWTDHTFNPWWGCVKVSEGCKFCYAERDSKRWGMDLFGEEKERRFFGEKHWNEPIKWNKEAEKAGERRRVFCASMADLFEDNRTLIYARAMTFALIEKTPWLDWLVLTKRPENVMGFVPHVWTTGFWPENAWLGYTAENQKRFDERHSCIGNIPAPIKFISVEPMLEAIDLYDLFGIDWVIFGAESGPHRRHCELQWVIDGIDQVHEHDSEVFVKQLHINGVVSTKPEEWPEGLRVQEFPV